MLNCVEKGDVFNGELMEALIAAQMCMSSQLWVTATQPASSPVSLLRHTWSYTSFLPITEGTEHFLAKKCKRTASSTSAWAVWWRSVHVARTTKQDFAEALLCIPRHQAKPLASTPRHEQQSLHPARQPRVPHIVTYTLVKKSCCWGSQDLLTSGAQEVNRKLLLPWYLGNLRLFLTWDPQLKGTIPFCKVLQGSWYYNTLHGGKEVRLLY